MNMNSISTLSLRHLYVHLFLLSLFLKLYYINVCAQQIYYTEENVSDLIIKEVFPEDAGTFTVVAKNVVGYTSCSCELIVGGPLSDHGSNITPLSRRSLSRESSVADFLDGIPPLFSQKPKEKIVDKGDDAELECRLVGFPQPEVG